MPPREPLFPSSVALAPLLSQLCAELAQGPCPEGVRPGYLQAFLFELPVVSACFAGLFLAITLRLPALAKAGWATGDSHSGYRGKGGGRNGDRNNH